MDYIRPSKGQGGVYVIWLSDTHFYGGSTKSFRERWYEHLRTLRKGVHKNPHMQNVFNRNHRFEPRIIKVVRDLNLRISSEQGWLDENFGVKGCVNICAVAEAAPMEGRTHSEESRAKMSAAKRGRKLSRDHCQALSEAHKRRHREGNGFSEETRAKISKGTRGKKRPDNAARNRARTGWEHTEAAKVKIGAAANFTGRSHSPEAREKISKALKGRKPSAETLRKRSEGLKAAWARRKAREDS